MLLYAHTTPPPPPKLVILKNQYPALVTPSICRLFKCAYPLQHFLSHHCPCFPMLRPTHVSNCISDEKSIEINPKLRGFSFAKKSTWYIQNNNHEKPDWHYWIRLDSTIHLVAQRSCCLLLLSFYLLPTCVFVFRPVLMFLFVRLIFELRQKAVRRRSKFFASANKKLIYGRCL